MIVRHLLVIAGLLVTASPAIAGDAKGKKRARPKTPDVAAALATGDATRICQAAIDLVVAGDHVRASLLLPRCPESSASDEPLAEAARKARIAVRKVATAEDWSPVELIVNAPDAVVTIEPYADVPVAPGRVELPAGAYRIVARTSAGAADYRLTVAGGKRALVMITPPVPPAPAKAGIIDFGKDEPLPPPVAGPPPKVKHGSLLPERYRKGLCTGKCAASR